MSCFKLMQDSCSLSWNIFNLVYVMWALVFAFLEDSLAIRFPSFIVVFIHLIFTIALNAFLRKKLEEDNPMIECLMLLLNCSAIFVSALLIILTTQLSIFINALPIILYVFPLHVLCLIAACLFKRGYDVVQKVCLIHICCKKAENLLKKRNSKASIVCARFENCFLNVITCDGCCKYTTKKKKINPTIYIKRQTLLELKARNTTKMASERHPSKINLLKGDSKAKAFQIDQETRYNDKSVDKSLDSSLLKIHHSEKRKSVHFQENDQDEFGLPDRNQSLSLRSITSAKLNATQAKKKFLEKVHRNMSQLTEFHKEQMKQVVELCTICIEEMHVRLNNKQKGEVGCLLTVCKHVFHTHCIEEYLKSHQKEECPMCQATIKGWVNIKLS